MSAGNPITETLNSLISTMVTRETQENRHPSESPYWARTAIAKMKSEVDFMAGVDACMNSRGRRGAGVKKTMRNRVFPKLSP